MVVGKDGGSVGGSNVGVEDVEIRCTRNDITRGFDVAIGDDTETRWRRDGSTTVRNELTVVESNFRSSNDDGFAQGPGVDKVDVLEAHSHDMC